MVKEPNEFKLEKTGIYSLSQITSLVKDTLENSLGRRVFPIMVEVANVKRTESGVYMELIEKVGGEVVSKVKGTLWRNVLPRLYSFEKMTGQRFDSGLQLLIHGKPVFHNLYGFSITIHDIDVTYTLGQIAQQRKQFIDKLLADHPGRITEEEGIILTPNKAIALPAVANRIAVISSASSDGYRDFLHELSVNPYKYHFQVTLFDTLVQGKTAEEMMIKSLLAIYHRRTEFDLVVMIRGGGSDLDFAAYDQYALARSVALFPIPILTGLGHTRNETLCDLVSHQAFKTPTKVATHLIEAVNLFTCSVREKVGAISRIASQIISVERTTLQIKISSLNRDSLVFLQKERTDVQLKLERTRYLAMSLLQQQQAQLQHKFGMLKQSALLIIQKEQSWINSVCSTIDELNPVKRYQQGYFLLRKEGVYLQGNQPIEVGDRLDLVGKKTYKIIIESTSQT